MQKPARKQLVQDSSDDDNDLEAEERDLAKQLAGASDDEAVSDAEAADERNIAINSLAVSEHVLVAVHGKRTTKHFVAVISAVMAADEEISVDFLKSVGNQFVFPDEKDSATVHIDDIVLLLPSPAVCGGTKRTSEHLSFPIDLAAYI